MTGCTTYDNEADQLIFNCWVYGNGTTAGHWYIDCTNHFKCYYMKRRLGEKAVTKSHFSGGF